MKIQLSICIPTYNFGAFIGETLDSILPQMNDAVELVVLDSNSKDQTQEVCQSRFAKYPKCRTRYIKSNERGGIDRDIEAVVAQASGEYVWLFSADDILLPESINKIIANLSTQHDVYLSEHILCDLRLNRISPHPIFNGISPGTEFELTNNESRLNYFESARTSEAFFSFLSTPIFKKSIWDRVGNLPEVFYGSCWAHAGRLLLSSKMGMRVKYLGQQLLLKRGENDSFSDKGRVHRMGIAIEGYSVIANIVFGDGSSEAFNIRRVIRFELPLMAVMLTKLKAYQYPKNESLEKLDALMRIHYSDKSAMLLIYQFIYYVSNKWMLEFVYSFVRRTKRILRLANQLSVKV